ncbi:MAG: sodium:alanine symporter family protein [Bacilli bacterium]|nr:sodium:alanine symporter family protein [Acholeplasmataceae bacterium]MDY2901919.1 sodium:alanine symporter family protein [Bacilli bacterium]
MEKLTEVISKISEVVWGIPLIVLILFVGVLLTIRLKGLQITKLGKSIKYSVMNEEGGVGEVSSFGALCISLSATIGTGSIVGVATAIKTGGPGALFWMIVAAILGMATKYAEGFLAIRYRHIREDGTTIGGPFAYIEYGMGKKWKWLAKTFSIFAMIAGVMGIGTLTQISGITSSIENVFLTSTSKTINIFGNDISLIAIIAGLVVTICTALVIIGGIKRIESVCIVIVPVMAISYVLICILLLICNIKTIPSAFSEIIKCAFNTKAITGGFTGTLLVVIQVGIARGIFSNESGLGSVPIASSTAKTKDPVRQGLVAMTSTFYTIIICIMTGLAIVVTKTWLPETGNEGVIITTKAFEQGLPFPEIVSACLLMISMVFFAFTTIVGWNVYGVRCLEYFTNYNKIFTIIYKWLWVLAVFIGPYLSIKIIWTTADIFNAFMAIPNLIALIFLSGRVSKETDIYFKEGLKALKLEEQSDDSMC